MVVDSHFIIDNLVGMVMCAFAFIPTFFGAAYAVTLHALLSDASDEMIERFNESLHPSLKHAYANYLSSRQGNVISNFLGMMLLSMVAILFILGSVIGIANAVSMTIAYTYGFWALISIFLLIRIWLFGIKFHFMKKK